MVNEDIWHPLNSPKNKSIGLVIKANNYERFCDDYHRLKLLYQTDTYCHI